MASRSLTADARRPSPGAYVCPSIWNLRWWGSNKERSSAHEHIFDPGVLQVVRAATGRTTPRAMLPGPLAEGFPGIP